MKQFPPFPAGSFPRDEYNSTLDITLPKNQFAEIFVCCQKQSSFIACQSKHFLVRNPGIHFSDVLDIMPILSQADNNGTVNPFIGKYIHQADSAVGYTTSARKESRAKASAA